MQTASCFLAPRQWSSFSHALLYDTRSFSASGRKAFFSSDRHSLGLLPTPIIISHQTTICSQFSPVIQQSQAVVGSIGVDLGERGQLGHVPYILVVPQYFVQVYSIGWQSPCSLTPSAIHIRVWRPDDAF